VRPIDEIQSRLEELRIHRLHAPLIQRARVLDSTVGVGVDDTPGAIPLRERPSVAGHQIGRVIRMLRLFLGIQVIQVAVELVEAMVCGQVLVKVT
jgi:hypothetical protein